MPDTMSEETATSAPTPLPVPSPALHALRAGLICELMKTGSFTAGDLAAMDTRDVDGATAVAPSSFGFNSGGRTFRAEDGTPLYTACQAWLAASGRLVGADPGIVGGPLLRAISPRGALLERPLKAQAVAKDAKEAGYVSPRARAKARPVKRPPPAARRTPRRPAQDGPVPTAARIDPVARVVVAWSVGLLKDLAEALDGCDAQMQTIMAVRSILKTKAELLALQMRTMPVVPS